jgi:hypothetical protein
MLAKHIDYSNWNKPAHDPVAGFLADGDDTWGPWKEIPCPAEGIPCNIGIYLF